MIPLPAPANAPNAPTSSEPPSGDEAKAKAHEMKSHEAEAKAKAAKEGKPTTEEGPKPVSIAVPAVPQPKSAAHEAAPAAGAAKAGHQAKPGGKGGAKGEPTAKSAGNAPAKGPAGAGAKADVDAEVAAYIAKAPKDHSKEEVHKNVKALADGAKSLQANAPPAAKGDGAVMSTLKTMVPGMDSIGAKPGESDWGKITGDAPNPYKDFDKSLGNWGPMLSRTRDVVAGISSILGKVGIVLTVVGLLISITGIGAPLGAPIAAIGRVLGIITLVLDAITFVLSAILTAMLAMRLNTNPPPSPEMRKKMAAQLLSESSQTFQALLSVGLALPGVGKIAGAAAGGLKKIATGIGKIVGKFVGKVGLGIAKGLGKIIAASFNKLKTVFGSTLAKSGPGFLDKALSVGGKAVGAVEKVGSKVSHYAGKGAAFLTEKINAPLERALASAEKTGVGKFAKKIDGKAIAFGEALDKYTGKNLLEKGERGIGYYGSKLGAKADVAAEKAATSAESGLGKRADAIQQNAERAGQKNAEEQAAKAAKEAEAKAAREAAEKEAELKAAQQDAGQAGKTEAKEGKPPGENTPPAENKQAPPAENKAPEGGTAPTEGKTPEGSAAATEGKTAEPKPADPKPADPAATPDPNAPKEKHGWDEYMEKRQAALDKAKANQAAATKARVDQEKSATKAEATAEQAEVQRLKDAKAPKEEIAAQEKRAAKAEKKAQDVENSIKSKEADEEAAKRADQRLNDARGGKDAEGKTAAGLSDADRAKHSEIGDATRWEDPAKETTAGVYAEKIAEPLELKKSSDEANSEWKKDLASEAANHAREEAHEDAQEGKETVTIAEFESGGEGTLSSSVHGMIGDLEPKHDEKKGHGHDDHGHGHGHDHAHDQHGNAPNTPNHANDQGGDHGTQAAGEHGGEHGNQAPAPAGDHGAAPAHAEGKGGEGAPGALPYWPELLKDYANDLTILSSTESDLQKYREAQIAGYKSAVGIKDASDKEKQKTQERKPQTAATKTGAKEDAQVLQNTATHAGQTGTQAQAGKGKEGQASSAGSEGAAAAGTPVPEPPAPHWWDAIINLAKKFIVNYLAKALKWVQDWFTDKIIRMFTGGKLNLEKVNEMATGTGEQAGADVGKSKGSEGVAGQAENKDKEAEAKAEENKSTAQKLHDECVKNVASADELLQTIAQLKTLITQEIKNGETFLKELRDAKEKEKQALHAKEEQQKKEQQQKDAQAQKEAQAHGGHGHGHGHDKDKDHADAGQVAKVKAAANAVATGSTQYHQRVQKGFQSAKSTLAGEKGNKKLDHEVVEHAINAYEQHAGQAVKQHQEGAEHRATKMKAIAGKGDFKASDLHGAGSEVEGAAKEADESLRDTLVALKGGFESAYKAQHKHKAHKEEMKDLPPTHAPAKQAPTAPA